MDLFERQQNIKLGVNWYNSKEERVEILENYSKACLDTLNTSLY